MNLKKKIIFSLAAITTLSSLYANETKTNLNEVTVVSAAGYEQDLITAPATITVITAEDLLGKSYMNVGDALQDVPGVTIEGGGSGTRGKGMGSSSISIRGMSSEYTLLLVDGKAQGNSGQVYYNGEGSGQEMGWLPPLSSIERIEIIKGPMSSLYGSQALGGVVNIITKKVLDEWSGNVTIDKTIQANTKSGDENQYKYFMTGPLIKDTLGIAFYGMYSQRDEDEIEYGYRENRIQNNNVKLNWHINDKNDLSLEYGYFTQEASGTVENIGTDTDKEVKKEVYSLIHDYNWNDKVTTKSFVQYEVMNNEFQNEGTEYLSTFFNSKTVLPFDTNNMTLGVEYKNEATDHGTRGLNLTNLERSSGSLFVEDEYFVSEDLSITAGARWNEDEKYGGELTPRIYGVYKLSTNFTLKSGISSGYLTPNLKQGDSGWVEGGFGGSTDGADIGNDDLTPEKSLSYELGIIYNNADNFNLSFTGYNTTYDDKIEKLTVCDTREGGTGDATCIYYDYDYVAIAQYQNVDEAELKGVEIAVSYAFDTVNLNANYTYSDSEITSGNGAGEPLNNYPKHQFNAGINANPIEDLKLWSKLKYKGKTLEDDNSVPAYTIVDLGLNYDISESLSVHSGIYNLFDKEITYEEYSKILDGRRYSFGMNIKF